MASLESLAKAPFSSTPLANPPCSTIFVSQPPSQRKLSLPPPSLASRLASPSATSPSTSPSFVSSVASNLCNALEELVNAMEPPWPRASDPAINFASNFYPLMDECPPMPCMDITGTIPQCLNGVYVRNGPNPLHMPKAGYHPFDGDGMIHAVRISNGEATHACRFTQTNRYVHEKAAGQPLFVKPLGELNGLPGLAKLGLQFFKHSLGLLDMDKGIGPANAGLAFFNGKLLAMSEDDMPYWVKICSNGDLETIGRFDFSGKLKSTMTAHPKVDPSTGEMFAFNYNLLQPPYLNYFRLTPSGEKLRDVPITLKEPTLVHDFAITKRYAVFCDNQIVFRLQEMFDGGSPIVCDPKKVPRVGIMPKYDTNEANIKWFDCPSSTCFHFLNAWEEGDEVVMVGSANKPVEVIFNNPERLECRLTEFRFNVSTGRCSREQVSSANIDVGRINENYIGRKIRYAYLCTSGPWPSYSGVCKVDLEAPRLSPGPSRPGVNTCEPCIVGWRNFGEGCYGSEPFFVPTRGGSGEEALEDDGYVLTFVHDQAHDRSELLIMDAQSPTLAIVASITMPIRVPCGFHGLFISERQLQEQI